MRIGVKPSKWALNRRRCHDVMINSSPKMYQWTDERCWCTFSNGIVSPNIVDRESRKKRLLCLTWAVAWNAVCISRHKRSLCEIKLCINCSSSREHTHIPITIDAPLQVKRIALFMCFFFLPTETIWAIAVAHTDITKKIVKTNRNLLL